jgi:hypothetical protein
MNDARAISAQLVDIRNVGTHKVVKLTLHAPEEQAMQIMKLFGWPTGVNPIPVAIARLVEGGEAPALQQSPLHSDGRNETQPRPVTDRQASPAGADKQRKPFGEMLPSQQAGMLSQDRAFRLFLAEKFDLPIPDPDEAASIIRYECGVKSRADIKPENAKWSALVLAYRMWQRAAEIVPA